jgi:hypothetical protein
MVKRQDLQGQLSVGCRRSKVEEEEEEEEEFT